MWFSLWKIVIFSKELRKMDSKNQVEQNESKGDIPEWVFYSIITFSQSVPSPVTFPSPVSKFVFPHFLNISTRNRNNMGKNIEKSSKITCLEILHVSFSWAQGKCKEKWMRMGNRSSWNHLRPINQFFLGSFVGLNFNFSPSVSHLSLSIDA